MLSPLRPCVVSAVTCVAKANAGRWMSSVASSHSAWVDRLVLAYTEGSMISEDEWESVGSMEEGMAVQRDVVAELVSRGAVMGGYKLGATNKVIQDRLGITEPFEGPILLDATTEANVVDSKIGCQRALMCSSGETVVTPIGRGLRGVEAEWVFVFDGDVPSDASIAGIASRVSSVYPAIEVISTRYDRSGALPIADMVADLGVHGCMVQNLGAAMSMEEWEAGNGEVSIKVTAADGSVEDATGSAVDVLGGPTFALKWLVEALGSTGRQLRAGEHVSTGTMTGLLPAAPGSTAVASFETSKGVATVGTTFQAPE